MRTWISFLVTLSAINAMAAAEPAKEFKSVIQAVLDQAASVEAQRAASDLAKEQSRAKSLYWTPTGSVALTHPFAGTSPNTGAGNSTILTAGLNVFKFGSNDLARQASNSRIDAESARTRQLQEDIETSTANLIFQLIQQRQVIEIDKGHVNIQQQSLDVARERYKQGQLAEQEFEKAKVDLDAAQVALAAAKLNEIQTLNSIKTLADINTGISDWPLDGSKASGISSKPKRSANQFYNVMANSYDADYFHKNAQQTWRSIYLPSLDLAGGWTNTSISSTVNGQWYSGIVLTIPLWDQWAGVAQAQEFESNSRSSHATALQDQRQAQASLDTLDLRMDLALRNLQSSQQSVRKLQELRNDSLKRFRMGRSSVNDFLIDENRFLDAENSLQNSMLAYHQLRVEACHIENETVLNCF